MKRIVYYIVFINIILFFGACKREQKYSEIPFIEYDGIDIIRDQLDPVNLTLGDSLIIRLKFQDGDGDLGIANNDLNTSENNYILRIFERKNGVYSFLSEDSGKFPYLSTDNVVGPIDGVLSRSIIIPHSSPFVPKDTIRFDITIKDRSNNLSNTITTPAIIVYK